MSHRGHAASVRVTHFFPPPFTSALHLHREPRIAAIHSLQLWLANHPRTRSYPPDRSARFSHWGSMCRRTDWSPNTAADVDQLGGDTEHAWIPIKSGVNSGWHIRLVTCKLNISDKTFWWFVQSYLLNYFISNKRIFSWKVIFWATFPQQTYLFYSIEMAKFWGPDRGKSVLIPRWIIFTLYYS